MGYHDQSREHNSDGRPRPQTSDREYPIFISLNARLRTVSLLQAGNPALRLDWSHSNGLGTIHCFTQSHFSQNRSHPIWSFPLRCSTCHRDHGNLGEPELGLIGDVREEFYFIALILGVLAVAFLASSVFRRRK